MTLRIGLLGSGWVADVHHQAAVSAGFDVVAVASHDADRTADFAGSHGIPRWTTDWRAMCAEPDIDAVVVATPNFLHAEQVLHALSCGLHVLVEKPMAIAVADAEAMVNAAEVADRILCVGHMWRYRDEVLSMRDRVVAGEFGRVVRTNGFGVHAGWGPSGWFTHRALAGGGALIDMGIHAIDTARFVLGDPKPVRVSASLGTAYGDYDVDDDGVVLVEWDNDVRSVIECGWWQPALRGVEADTVVYGTGGSGRIWPDMPPLPAGYVHCSVPMYAAQMGDFGRACMGGGTPDASADVGLTALRIVADAYACAAAGQAARSEARL